MINIRDIKRNLFKKENIYFFVLILFIFFLDRYSKNLILDNFSEKRFFIYDFFNFDLTWNTGIGFGLFSSDLEIIYNSLTFLIGFVIFILFYLSLISTKIDKFIYSIIIGGALGNFYDRLQYKAVPDFIDFHIGNFHWFTFNVSDVFISFGVIVFILKGFYEKN